MTPQPTDRWLTTAEVARLCRVEQSTVRSWVQREHVEVDKRGRISAASLLAYLDRRGTRGQRTGPRPAASLRTRRSLR